MKRLLLATVLLGTIAGCHNRNDQPGTVHCNPGEIVEIGCASACGLGMCMGDATLRFCDGNLDPSSCQHSSDSTMFVSIDDSCGTLCPFGRVTCPASGAITVVPGAIGSADCVWESRNLGVLPPGGRGAEVIACTPGAPMRVGCSDTCGIGHCASSTAELDLCDGTVAPSMCGTGASGVQVLEVTDSSVSGTGCDFHCPEAVVTCPASGMLTVSPRALGSATDFWCQWDAVSPPHHADDLVQCTPGTRVVVGCAAGCNAGSCVGNGGIRVCDGALTAADCRAQSTGNLGDAYGRSSCDDNCPETVVTCPPSGAITVVSAASFTSTPSFDEGFACDWTTRPAGLGE